MDLREWIANDHASVLTRFDNAIGRHVPVQRWKEAAEAAEPSAEPSTVATGASIAWLLFHTTYHQDLALNVAIRDHEPLLAVHRDELGLEEFGPSDGLSEAEDRGVTDALVLDALRRYVESVNSATRTWIEQLSTMALDSVPANSYRLEHRAGIATGGELTWLHDMWDARPVSWLLQWECIGHGHAHVGEMVGVRNRLGLSPF